jgi:hypothetical protein
VKASEIVRNVVKEKLDRNEVVASMTVRLVRGVEIARLAKTAGFDMIYIDLEHSTMTLEATGQICQAALSAGLAPMVRVPANTSDDIQRVASTTCSPISDLPASSITPRCATPMRGRSPPAASTASMSASAACRPGQNSPPSLSPWARACCRPEPTFSFCSPP